MQAQIQCPSCGMMNPTGKVFCASCGNALMATPGSQQGSGTPTRAVSPSTPLAPPPAPPPPAPYSGPSSAPLPAAPPPQQQSSWLEPTQAYPPPAGLYPVSQPPYQPPVQPAQPAPYQPPAQYPPTQQYPTGQMPAPQYDPYASQGYAAAPPQYAQYGQYGGQGGQPTQYVNVQVTGAYPYGPYGAQPTGAYAAAPTVQRNPLAFWGLWIVATTIAWAIAVPSGFALWGAIQEPLINNVLVGLLTDKGPVTQLIIVFTPLFLLLGIAIGIISGVAGALVLAWKGVKGAAWFFSTIIGWSVGAVAGWIVWVLMNNTESQLLTGGSSGLTGGNPLGSGLYTVAIFGAIAGGVLGILQFLALRRHTGKAALWILASPAAWAITGVALVLVANALLQSSFGVSLNPIMSESIYGAAVGVVAGATTGGALAAIL